MGQKAGINEAHEITGMSKHFLRLGAKSGMLPHIRSGSKIIFDIPLLEEYLRNQAIANVRPQHQDNVGCYGKLRKIEV